MTSNQEDSQSVEGEARRQRLIDNESVGDLADCLADAFSDLYQDSTALLEGVERLSDKVRDEFTLWMDLEHQASHFFCEAISFRNEQAEKAGEFVSAVEEIILHDGKYSGRWITRWDFHDDDDDPESSLITVGFECTIFYEGEGLCRVE